MLWLTSLCQFSTHFLKFRSLVEEIEGMIYKVGKVLVPKFLSVPSQVDPKKKVEVGSFRISGDGTQEGRKLVGVVFRKVFKSSPDFLPDPICAV